MVKILFGQSYYLRFDPKLWEAMQPYPPLGTMYAASLLRQNGYEVSLFDAMLAESEDEWSRKLDAESPDIAIIFEDNFNYLSKMCLLRMREAALKMIEMARSKGCAVIIGGADATDHASLYLEHGANYALIGEGDLTLVDLISYLNGKSDLSLDNIAGIAYLSNEELHRTSPRPPIRDLDALPFPTWDLIDVKRYKRIWYEHHDYYSMNMITTRGCPYHCNWCAKPIWGQRYNSRSPQNVTSEMLWLKQTYQPDHIWFADDIMGLKPGWWQAFAEQIEGLDAHIPFKCLNRADLISHSPENVENMRRAGCTSVWIGAESGSQKILNAMEKGTSVDQIYTAAHLLHNAGIKIGLFLQFGYPGEAWEDIQGTLQMMRTIAPDDIGMSVSYPLPGTKFYESVKLQLGEKQNWIDSADLAMMYHGPFSTDFYRQLHLVLHKEFRLRRAVRNLQYALTRPLTLRPARIQEGAVSLYRIATLPIARWKLRRLAHQKMSIFAPPPHMPFEEAAQPSPQTE